MPKSKKHRKRRGKVKQQKYSRIPIDKGWDGKGGYIKTDGQGRRCRFDKHHNFIDYLDIPYDPLGLFKEDDS